jgi:hypothetical protein
MTAAALLHFRASFVTLGRYVDVSKKMENLWRFWSMNPLSAMAAR